MAIDEMKETYDTPRMTVQDSKVDPESTQDVAILRINGYKTHPQCYARTAVLPRGKKLLTNFLHFIEYWYNLKNQKRRNFTFYSKDAPG